MTTWFFKLLAQLKLSAHMQRASTDGSAALHTAVRPIRGTAAAAQPTGTLPLPAGRGIATSTRPPCKPLRIIEWVESANAHHPSSRRMVMSGRLADICAELDRLAALEGA